jgi:hypothetical protein
MRDGGRRPATLLTLVAVVAGSLAGCGGKSSPQGTVPASTYIGQLCTSAASWFRGLEAHTSALEAELGPRVTPAEGKRVVESLVSTAVSDTESVVTSLRSAGVPDVNNGKRISSTVLTSFEGITTRLAGLQAQAAALPTNNPAAFHTEAMKIRETIREAPLRLGIGISGVNSPELEKAASESNVCKSVGARAKTS